MASIYDYLDKNLYVITNLTSNPDGTSSATVQDTGGTSAEVSSENLVSGEIDGCLSFTGGFIQSKNFVSGTSGWRLSANGTLEAVNATLSGAITATSGTIGGFTITATNLSATGLVIDSSTPSIVIGTGANAITLDGSTGTISGTGFSINGSGTSTFGNAAQQTIAAETPTGTRGETYFSTSYLGLSAANPMFAIVVGATGVPIITRYIKLANGSVVATHQVAISTSDAGNLGFPAVLGSYLYVLTAQGGNPKLLRFDIANLANETLMTISGTALTVTTALFSDGTDLYNMYTAGAAKKYTVSGTTATSGADTSYTSATTQAGYWSDATSLYGIVSGSVYKWALSGGARTTGTTLVASQYFISNGTGTSIQTNGGIFKEVGNTTQILTVIMNKGTFAPATTPVIGKMIPITTF